MHAPLVRPAKLTALVVLALIMTSLIAACISGDDDGDDRGGRSTAPTTTLETEGVAVEGEAVMDDAAEERPSDGSAPGGDLTAYAPSYVASEMPLDRMIIRTVTLDLTVADVGQGVIWLRDLAARKNGFIFSSNTYERDESQFAQITIRVPAEELEATMQELREHDLVVRVDREESTSKDVSQEYVDNEARLEALEETQRRFMALLSEADTVEEILRIEAELTNIRSQIETIKGRQNYLDQMTAFSTVTVTLTAEGHDVQMADAVDDGGFIARIFGDAWDSASGVIEGLLTGTITVGIIGLAVLPFALLIFFAGRIAYHRLRPLRSTVSLSPATQPAVEDNQ